MLSTATLTYNLTYFSGYQLCLSGFRMFWFAMYFWIQGAVWAVCWCSVLKVLLAVVELLLVRVNLCFRCLVVTIVYGLELILDPLSDIKYIRNFGPTVSKCKWIRLNNKNERSTIDVRIYSVNCVLLTYWVKY